MITRRMVLVSASATAAAGNGAADAQPVPAQGPGGAASLQVIAADNGRESIALASRLASLAGNDMDRIRVAPGRIVSSTLAQLVERFPPTTALLAADMLSYVQQAGSPDRPEQSLRYIARLYYADLHVAASRRIRTLADLAGQPVALGVRGSQTQIVSSLFFQRARIPVMPLFLEPDTGYQSLLSGKVAGLVALGPRPLRLFFNLNLSDDIHFLPVPPRADLLAGAIPVQIQPEDYPMLGGGEAGGGVAVPTLAVPMVLAVFDWPQGSEPYQTLARFTALVFQRASALPGFDPAADVPGWVRFSAATLPLGRVSPPASRLETTARSALERHPSAPAEASNTLSPDEKERLFRGFMRWLDSRR